MTPTPDPALAARLAELKMDAHNGSIPEAMKLTHAIRDAYRSGQLITLADHEAAMQEITYERDFLRAQVEAMREMAPPPVPGLLKKRLLEVRAQSDAMQAAVAKAVEAEREACANEVILQYKLWEDYGAAGFDDLCIAVIPSAIRTRKGDAL